jgi:hypothetical protein
LSACASVGVGRGRIVRANRGNDRRVLHYMHAVLYEKEVISAFAVRASHGCFAGFVRFSKTKSMPMQSELTRRQHETAAQLNQLVSEQRISLQSASMKMAEVKQVCSVLSLPTP